MRFFTFHKRRSIVSGTWRNGTPWSPPFLACKFLGALIIFSYGSKLWFFLSGFRVKYQDLMSGCDSTTARFLACFYLFLVCRYLVSLVYTWMLLPGAKFLGVASSLPELCSTAVLRSINVGLALVCSLLFSNIVRHLEPKKSEKNALWKAFLLSLYPLHWFFSFLYYTGSFFKLSSSLWCHSLGTWDYVWPVMAIL